MSEIWGGDILTCDDIVMVEERGGREGDWKKGRKGSFKNVFIDIL